MVGHPFTHVVSHAFREAKHMPGVGAGKSAVVAFFAGFLLGPLGVGLYLRSLGDFVVTLGLVVVGSMLTVGVGAPVFWALCGAWAAYRVSSSK